MAAVAAMAADDDPDRGWCGHGFTYWCDQLPLAPNTAKQSMSPSTPKLCHEAVSN